MFPHVPKTWHMPDGTKTVNKPRDGAVFHQFDPQGNPTTWQWDGLQEHWVNVSSGKPTPQNTRTFVINCPMDLDNIELEPGNIDWSQHRNFNCECGSEKCGSNKHSSWCPKYKP